MINSFQTSFVPKKPVSNTVSEKKPVNPFTLVSVIILVIALLATIGLFFYKVYLTNHKEVLSSSLNKAKDSFEKETIDELKTFSKRAEISKQILEEHIILSPMLTLIGEMTIPTVQYTKFDHQTTDKKFIVKMQGVALDYKSIALQSDMFNSPKGQYFKNVVFSNLIRNTISTAGNNYITFDVEFNVEPSLLSFSQNQVLNTTPAFNNDYNYSNNSIIEPVNADNDTNNSSSSEQEPNPSNSPAGTTPTDLNISL